MSTILQMPRRKKATGIRARLANLPEMVAAARSHAKGLPHAAEMEVLVLYVKCDPPAHQLAAELGIPAADSAALLNRASGLLVTDEAFRTAFHAINSRLD